jgi:hypothetical protein
LEVATELHELIILSPEAGGEHCPSVLPPLCFTNQRRGWLKLKLTALKILFAQITKKPSFAKVSEDAFVLTQLIFDELWSIEEAIQEGFSSFVKRRTAEIEDALWYHARNCNSHCIICSDLESIGVSNEREKPRLCA